MRITFIGTSHGIPEPNRKCSCTMLEVGGNIYMIDAGTSPIDALINRGISYDRVKALFITHRHGDHTDGLIHFVDICSWTQIGKRAETKIFLPEMVLLDGIKAWYSVTERAEISPKLEFAEVSEGLIYDDGTIKVTALRTGHIDISYAYLIEAEGKKVLFTGDMTPKIGPTADYARFITEDGFDLVVAECAHFPADLYLEPIRKHPPKKFVFNHYSPRFSESCYRVRTQLENEVPVILAADNMEIDV